MKELLAACGGSNVFSVLVYEAYGLDRAFECHWTSAQKAEGEEPQPDSDSSLNQWHIHRKTAPFGLVG